MSSPNKAKGTAWETRIVRVLGAFFTGRTGLAPRRTAQEGMLDTGDIHGVSPVILQAKAWANVADALREGVRGAPAQARRAGEAYGVAIIKRPRAAAGDAYAAMRLEDFARFLLRLRRAEASLQLADPDAYGRHLAETAADLAQEFPR